MQDLRMHTPVLADELVRWLEPRPGRVYCDATVGGGGHAERILAASGPDSRLVGLDRDRAALEQAGARLAPYGPRAILVHASFATVAQVLAEQGIARVHGFVLDLGPSSLHFDTAERGFSFAREGPIDMRMDATCGETALDLIRRLGTDQLAAILRDWGEERYHRRIAKQIKEAAKLRQLHTTTQLADLVAAAIPAAAKRHLRIHPATKTFQALRIAVNDELGQLARFLDLFPDLLAPGGRCAIVSFHSLEDRLVKRRFRALAKTSSLPPDLAARAGERSHPVCRVLTPKPAVPSGAEMARNPRSRSARLRACERCAPP